MVHILLPKTLGLDQSIILRNSIEEHEVHDTYYFDLSELSWVHPFGMLFTAQAIKDLRKKYPESELEFVNPNFNDAFSYAAYMSFFTSCGIEYGNKPSFRAKTSTYIPITYADTKQLNSTDSIEAISRELAEQLTQDSSNPLVDALEYSFREMIRNVVEHSESETLGYCAQYWPRKELVELAILDTGIGLHQSLSQNPHLPLENDQDALKYALMPGISGKTYKGVKLRHEDHWQNSGYGLYMNYRLCNEGGSFFICSGSRGLLRRKDNDKNQYYPTNFQGTALRLRMNTQRLRDVKNLLKQFSAEGEAHALKFGMGAIPTASTMSKMLRENFQILADQINVGDLVKHKQYGKGIVESKLPTPQGEMLRILFNGERSKRVLSSHVVKWDSEDYQYTEIESEELEWTKLEDFDDYHSEDFDFRDFFDDEDNNPA